MSNAATVTLVQLVIYGPLFTWMLCQGIHRKALNKLRDAHREEREKDREEAQGRVEEERARREATRGDTHSSLSLVSSTSPLMKVMQDARLRGTVEGLSDSVSGLRKRVAALEAERKNSQEGAA